MRRVRSQAGAKDGEGLRAPSSDRLQEALRFASFLADLSALLAAAEPAGTDGALNEGLRRLASALGLERAFLGRLIDGGLSITHHWISEGLDEHRKVHMERVNPADFWVARECLGGTTLVITGPDDFPSEAVRDRTYFEERELQSSVWVPGVLASKVVGCVVVDSFSPSKVWSPEFIERLKVPVEMLFWATERNEAVQELDERSRFDELLARISTSLVESVDLDERIEASLGEICSFLGMSLATVLLLDPQAGVFRHTHEWPGDPAVFRDVVVSEREWPWLAAKMAEEKPILISRPGELPPEAKRERATCEERGLETVIWVPYRCESAGWGYVAFNSEHHLDLPEQLVPRFALVGELIGHALERQRKEKDLRSALAENERLRERLEADNLYLRDEVRRHCRSGEIVGHSKALLEVLGQARQVAETDSTVLILGETGTGKELLARFIHEHSSRSERPMIKVNCGGLPSTLVETELFGHERGAYTGALGKQIGRFELADGSTIFLDEIGDLPLELQVKLLRVLQGGEFERLGSGKTRTVDVRVLAATNADLGEALQQGRFREDLFYRLNVFPITMPPLRERPEDIPDLVWRFVGDFAGAMAKPVESVPRRTLEALTRHTWPGNVRELRNVVERAMIVNQGPTLEIPVPEPRESPDADITSLDEVQRRHIVKVLERTRWRLRGKQGAAQLLEMKPSTLEYRMKKLGIERPR